MTDADETEANALYTDGALGEAYDLADRALRVSRAALLIALAASVLSGIAIWPRVFGA